MGRAAGPLSPPTITHEIVFPRCSGGTAKCCDVYTTCPRNASSLTDQQKLQATVAVGVVGSGINTALSLQSTTSTTTPATTPAQPASGVIAS